MRNIQRYFLRDIKFFTLIGLFFVAIMLFHNNTAIAMWIGFILAGYSAIANDSIQTLGTFFASNKKVPWQLIWLFLSVILVITFVVGWYTLGGDVSFGRLHKIPHPHSFTLMHLSAPLVLLILTRYTIPVSTTFLILSVFSNSKTIIAMVSKSIIGYMVAFIVAGIIWAIIGYLMKREILFRGLYNKKMWTVFQWFSTGYLWTLWLQQDIANIAVFLPRSISFEQLVTVVLFLVIGMGLLTFLRGGRIQKIVTEKSDVTDARGASIIDFVLGTIFLVFKEWNSLPMSTTWVFLGLLAGRELALTFFSGTHSPYDKTLALVMKDFGLATIGLLISIALALIGQGIPLSEFLNALTP